MSRNKDHAPVGYTCKQIDAVIDTLNTLYRVEEPLSKGELKELEGLMERIRSDNGQLRDWGSELHNKNVDLENEIDDLNRKVDSLEGQIESLKTETESLENEIDYLKQIQINHAS